MGPFSHSRYSLYSTDSPKSLLSLLRSRTTVDCDTLDASVAETYGPFKDCTSNQAIACFELQQHRHKELVQTSASLAKWLSSQYLGVTVEALAVEIGMISLGLQITPHLTGCMHIQGNPFDSYSTTRTIVGAERIVMLFRHLDPNFSSSRICIKIPSTWEGLQACRVLEAKGIKTLATTLFTLEQAALAGEAGCRYIAPYVNELRVHIDKDYHDPSPNLSLCIQAQQYYSHHSLPTQVLPASLTSIQECMAMAGAHHITIAPPILRELSAMEASSWPDPNFPSLFDEPVSKEEPPPKMSFMDNEEAFRMAFTRNGNGANEVKLVQACYVLYLLLFHQREPTQYLASPPRPYHTKLTFFSPFPSYQALNIFCDMQLRLEDAMRPLCA